MVILAVLAGLVHFKQERSILAVRTFPVTVAMDVLEPANKAPWSGIVVLGPKQEELDLKGHHLLRWSVDGASIFTWTDDWIERYDLKNGQFVRIAPVGRFHLNWDSVDIDPAGKTVILWNSGVYRWSVKEPRWKRVMSDFQITKASHRWPHWHWSPPIKISPDGRSFALGLPLSIVRSRYDEPQAETYVFSPHSKRGVRIGMGEPVSWVDSSTVLCGGWDVRGAPFNHFLNLQTLSGKTSRSIDHGYRADAAGPNLVYEWRRKWNTQSFLRFADLKTGKVGASIPIPHYLRIDEVSVGPGG